MKKRSLKKRIIGAAGFAIAAASASGMIAGASALAPVSAVAATTDYITYEKAKTIALNHANASASQITGYKAEFDMESYGAFYEIEFNYNGYEYDYKINASTGAIVETDKEPIRGYTGGGNTSNTGNTSGNTSNTGSTVSYIGEAKAKSTALSHAKLRDNQITQYKISLDKSRGVTYYDIDFKANGYEYDYDINASTGKIIKVTKELDDPVKARFTGVAEDYRDRWMYFKNGAVYTSFTGVAQSSKGNWLFVKNGAYTRNYTGVAKSTKGNWLFVKNGRFDKTFTGVAKSTKGNWIYVKNGRFTTNYTGVARSTKGNRLYVVKGRWARNYTGKYNNYNIRNGYVI